MRSLLKFILLMFACAPVAATAQPVSELLGIAADNNPGLKAMESEYLSALEKAPQVAEMPDPEVGVGIFVLPVETRLGPQWVRVGATQMLPWKGTLPARQDVVLAMARAQYEKIAATQLDLNYQVRQAWLKLYELEKLQQVLRRNIRIFRSMEQFALAKVESGKGTLADVLRVQAKVTSLNTELVILENQKAKPLASLNQVLNRPVSTPVTIADSLALAVIPYNKDTLASHIRLNHPMINMFSLQQEASRKALALNELEGQPSFGVGLDYIYVGKRTDAEPAHNGRDVIMPRATVKIPLYRRKYGAKVREEELKIAALDWQKQDMEARYIAMIEQAYTEQKDAALKLELYDELERITRAATEILQSQYSASGEGFDELLRLQSELVEYDLLRLKAVVQSHLAKAAIERFVEY